MKRTKNRMDCSTFRNNLAGRAAAGHLDVDVDMVAHAQQCPECRARLTAITALERAERMPVQTPAHLETRILAEIERRQDRRVQGQQSVHLVRPALAAAAVVLIALTAVVTTMINRTTMQTVPPVASSAAEAGAAPEIVEVHLVLEAPNAQSVAVAGDWNDWDTSVHRLTDPDGDGTWELRFRVKAGREYEYQFVVDESTWISDPRALIRVEDGFGGTNSILEI